MNQVMKVSTVDPVAVADGEGRQGESPILELVDDGADSVVLQILAETWLDRHEGQTNTQPKKDGPKQFRPVVV